MGTKFLIIVFLSFVALGLKAQNNSERNIRSLKKWQYNLELGIVRPGLSDSYFYSDVNNSQITSRKILEGSGFKANLAYGVNFGKRYYVSTSIGVYNYNTVFSDITTLPFSLHFKVNYFKSNPNTLYLQGNIGYSLPFRTTYQGFNFGYNLGYQFLIDKNRKHLVSVSLQNQVQNIIGTLEVNSGIVEPDGSVTKFTRTLTGNYKLSSLGLNLAYTF